MRSGGAKLLVLALALVVPLSGAIHTDELRVERPGIGALAHHHGPSGRCPEVKHHDCVACHATGVLAPSVIVLRAEPPQVRLTTWSHPEPVESRAAAPRRVGRSPPAFEAI